MFYTVLFSQSIYKSFIIIGLLFFWFIFLFISLIRHYRNFSKWELLKTSWHMVVGRFWFAISTTILMFVIYYLPEIITSLLTKQFGIPNLSLNIFPIDKASVYTWVMFVLKLVLMACVVQSVISTALKLFDKKEVNLKSTLRESFSVKSILFFIIGCIIYKILVFVGLFFFVVPAVIIAVMFSLWPFFMIDKGYGPIKSLTASLQTVQGVKVWDVFLFIILMSAINVLGLLVFGIGLLVTIPLTLLAFTHVYKQLTMGNEQVLPNVSSTPEFIAPPAVATPKTTRPRKKNKQFYGMIPKVYG